MSNQSTPITYGSIDFGSELQSSNDSVFTLSRRPDNLVEMRHNIIVKSRASCYTKDYCIYLCTCTYHPFSCYIKDYCINRCTFIYHTFSHYTNVKNNHINYTVYLLIPPYYNEITIYIYAQKCILLILQQANTLGRKLGLSQHSRSVSGHVAIAATVFVHRN